MESRKKLACNIAFIGDSGAGKTSLINNFIGNKYNEDERSTIGIDFKNKIEAINDTDVKYNILDISTPQEDHQSRSWLTLPLMQEYKNFVLVIDQTNKQSLVNAATWINKIRSKHQDAMIVAALSKTDAADTDKQVTLSDLKILVKHHKLKVSPVETSAKNSQGVREVIEMVRKKEEQFAYKNQNKNINGEKATYKTVLIDFIKSEMQRLALVQNKT